MGSTVKGEGGGPVKVSEGLQKDTGSRWKGWVTSERKREGLDLFSHEMPTKDI